MQTKFEPNIPNCEVEEIHYVYVQLPSREDEVEIEVHCGFDWHNDGIGRYEYWGSVYNDKGFDYVVCEATDWDKTGFTQEEIALVEKEIDKQSEGWCETITRDGKKGY